MNFYIGDSFRQLNANDTNAALDNEMVEYLYSVKNRIPYTAFFAIDPYSDTLVGKEDISDIISMSEYILNENVLTGYDESNEIIHAIKELKNLCCKAMRQCKRIIVIGD